MKIRWTRILLWIIIIMLSIYVFLKMTDTKINDRYFCLKTVNETAYSVLSSDLRITFPRNVIVKNVGIGGGREMSLYVKIILDKAVLVDFSKGINFIVHKIEDDNSIIEGICEKSAGLIGVFPWWNIDKADIKKVDMSENGLTLIIYMKEKNGEITVFITTCDSGATHSFAISSLMDKNPDNP